jgi:hypothetical protein
MPEDKANIVMPVYIGEQYILEAIESTIGCAERIGAHQSRTMHLITRYILWTNFTAEGFGIIPDKHFLANTPNEFMNAILKLTNDKIFYQFIARNAWQFIKIIIPTKLSKELPMILLTNHKQLIRKSWALSALLNGYIKHSIKFLTEIFYRFLKKQCLLKFILLSLTGTVRKIP